MTAHHSSPSLAILALLFEREQPVHSDEIYSVINHRAKHIQLAIRHQFNEGRIELIPGMGWVITDAGIDLLAEQE